MTLPQRKENHQDFSDKGININRENASGEQMLPKEPSVTNTLIADIDARPRRNPVIHWLAFMLALVSLAPPVYWLANHQAASSFSWLWLDTGLSIFFAIEFFTRSGFRWNPVSYVTSHFFDFVALVPVIVLAYYAVPFQSVWIWIVFITRFVRFVNRLLGDGFVVRNMLALLEGLEEEISDRVLIRIMDRVHDDLGRGKFGHQLSEAVSRNRVPVLNRIKSEHPQNGLGAGLARLTGLEAALEKAEARTFDAVVDILASPEIDHAIHEAVDSTFLTMRKEIIKKSWRKNLGIRYSFFSKSKS